MMRGRRAPASTLACLLLLAAACGSDSGSGDGQDDGGDGGDDGDDGGSMLPDGGPGAPDSGGPVDAAPIDCPDAELGALGELADGVATQEPFDAKDPDGPQAYLILGNFGEDRPLQMVLIDQRGAFAGTDVVPGTYPLVEADSSLSTCGVCLTLGLITDQAGFGMLPTAGSITIDAVGPNVTGSVADLTLQEQDPGTGAIVEGGCVSTAEGFSFDVVLSAPEAVPVKTRRAWRRAAIAPPPPATTPRRSAR
jgi:hypothetical protein